jgi:hypothetical protein
VKMRCVLNNDTSSDGICCCYRNSTARSEIAVSIVRTVVATASCSEGTIWVWIDGMMTTISAGPRPQAEEVPKTKTNTTA